MPHVYDKEGTEPEGKALNLPFNLHSCFQGQGYKRLKWVFSEVFLGEMLSNLGEIWNRTASPEHRKESVDVVWAPD